MNGATTDENYMDFLNEVEEDKELRKDIDIYIGNNRCADACQKIALQ